MCVCVCVGSSVCLCVCSSGCVCWLAFVRLKNLLKPQSVGLVCQRIVRTSEILIHFDRWHKQNAQLFFTLRLRPNKWPTHTQTHTQRRRGKATFSPTAALSAKQLEFEAEQRYLSDRMT